MPPPVPYAQQYSNDELEASGRANRSNRSNKTNHVKPQETSSGAASPNRKLPQYQFDESDSIMTETEKRNLQMRNYAPYAENYSNDELEEGRSRTNNRTEQQKTTPRVAPIRTIPQYRYDDSDSMLPEYSSSKKIRIRDQEVATADTNSTSGGEESDRVKDEKKCLKICLIIFGFLLLSAVVGILQFNASEKSEKKESKGKRGYRGSDYVLGTFPATIVLGPNEDLRRGDVVVSPSGEYGVRMTENGELLLQDMRESSNVTIWSAGVTGAVVCTLQSDGNVVVRDRANRSLWSSGSHKHNKSILVVDDGGRIGVIYKDTYVWMEGVPQGKYTGPTSYDLEFPVRGIFYYAWYPQTWKVSSGALAKYESDLGYYLSGDPEVAESHIDQLEYGNIDVGIISWFGPGSNLDIARITQLLDKTFDRKSQLKWTVYYEDEWKHDPTHEELKADLSYLKKWFAWHPTWAVVDGKPLIYIWNESDCEVIKRWMEATNGEWYVIPKLFSNYKDCPVQPDDWHQYGPASVYQRFKGHSVSISPGFWHAAEDTARLPRLSKSEWCANVQKMVNSREPWQLITTFNEAGEGTGVEATALHWPSESGYGYYLDCLHSIA
eukprot:scaffold2939_cov123-Cylindrotheca_fusiformis.AAC.1